MLNKPIYFTHPIYRRYFSFPRWWKGTEEKEKYIELVALTSHCYSHFLNSTWVVADIKKEEEKSIGIKTAFPYSIPAEPGITDAGALSPMPLHLLKYSVSCLWRESAPSISTYFHVRSSSIIYMDFSSLFATRSTHTHKIIIIIIKKR